MDLDTFITEFISAWPRLVSGTMMTVEVSLISIAIGTLLGTLLGQTVHYGKLPFRIAGWIYLDFIRGTPVLVLVMASYYVLPFLGFHVGAKMAGVIALSAFCCAHVAEIMRGALGSIPKGQTEAAKVIGLTFPKILFYVLLPQALRSATPPWVNTCIEIIKASTLLAVIGTAELLLTTQQIVSRNYMSIEFYLVAAVIYFSINYALSCLGKLIERRLAF